MSQQRSPRPAPRVATVIASSRLTANMHRVTLGGPGMRDFPRDQAGAYVKLSVPHADGKVIRTYTVRSQRGDEIDVDFALHGDSSRDAGPATNWALTAKQGDEIPVGGPGPAKRLPPGFDFYLVAGDMAALPAISANLEQMDRTATGLAILEIQHESDMQDIDAPDGVELRWIINSRPGQEPGRLGEVVRQVKWPSGRVYGWVACEFSAMRLLRSYLRAERELGPDSLYISSYWKAGLDEASHKIVKREDAEQV